MRNIIYILLFLSTALSAQFDATHYGVNTDTLRARVDSIVVDSLVKFNNPVTFKDSIKGEYTIIDGKNISLGQDCIYDEGSFTGNVAIGNLAGNDEADDADGNVFIGGSVAVIDTNPDYNVIIGSQAAQTVPDLDYNVIIGQRAATGGDSIVECVIIGEDAFQSGDYAANAVIIGSRVANAKDDISGSILIGADVATVGTAALTNKLWIDNSNTATPLIQGDFTDNSIRFNFKAITDTLGVGITEADEKVHVYNGGGDSKIKLESDDATNAEATITYENDNGEVMLIGKYSTSYGASSSIGGIYNNGAGDLHIIQDSPQNIEFFIDTNDVTPVMGLALDSDLVVTVKKDLIVEEDIVNDGVSLHKRDTISSSEFLTLATTPFDIIDAPGADKIIKVEGMAIKVDYNSAAYSGSASIELRISGQTLETMSSAVWTESSDNYFHAEINAIEAGNIVNQSVSFLNTGSNYTTGDSPIIVDIWYKIIEY
jgi:hypothetical protein